MRGPLQARVPRRGSRRGTDRVGPWRVGMLLTALAAAAACGGGDGAALGEDAAEERSTPADGEYAMDRTGAFGFGRAATPDEIARWDIDVGPDGEGLPPGSGSVEEGAAVYETGCARCHGSTGVEGPYGVVVATEGAEEFPFGRDPGLTPSIGNYWPYATTVFDYVRRSMPFDVPGSLTDDEVYAVTAWLLWRNGLLPEDAVLDARSLPAVTMPAKEHFMPSDDVSLEELP